jgi:CrcB protein
MQQMVTQYLVIGVGGALGSMGRFGVASLVDAFIKKGGPPYFLGTMLVNITGCFLIGFIFTISDTEGRFYLSPLQRQFVMIGILGGYTTFSSFTLQTLLLAQDGQWAQVAVNVLGSVVICLVGVWLGAMLAASINQIR